MLEEIIKKNISYNGPMTMQKYMQTCLTHSEFGYYVRKKNVFGEQGDFITAPEISPLFAEMLSVWIFQQWESLGKPRRIALLELGPGTGLLMQDILDTLNLFSEFKCVVDVFFYDSSKVLNVRQQEIWGANITKTFNTFAFLQDIDIPTIVIANEFFDALPVCQYVHYAGEVKEIAVDLDENQNFKCVEISTDKQPSALEESPDAIEILDELITTLKRVKGAAVIIDYGYWEGYGHTLQAMYKHEKVSIFDAPGQVDLSAHVNYKNLALHCKKTGLDYTYSTQREFLTNLGISLRLHSLLAQPKLKNKQNIIKGVERLIDAAEMGHLFKVLTIWTAS